MSSRLRGVLVGVVVAMCVCAGCRRSGGGAQLALVEAVPPGGFVWSGALTARSVDLVAGLRARDSVRLVVRPEPDSLGAFASESFALPETGRVVRAHLDGLTPGVRYGYAFEAGDVTLREGTFRTPEDGPFSFEIAVGGCALTGSSRPVFDAIRAADPLFFLHLGDMFYENIAVNSTGYYRRAFGRILRSPAQSALYRSTPLVYVWDDHDFGPNDSDRVAPGREAARQVYDELVPHYPLAGGPIYQAFTVGRVRFIVTDLRSSRDPEGKGDPDERTMMGAEQKAWFKNELRAAGERYPLIVWVSTVPWIGAASPTADHWGGYAEERREIADFIKDHDIRGVVILAGDAHMVAMDDGTNGDYATGGGAPIPVIQAAPLDQTGSFKGGPYSEGAFPNPSTFPPHPGQWVGMAVRDDGSEVCAEWTGYRTDWRSAETDEIVSWDRCFPAPRPARPAPASLGAADSTALDRLAELLQPSVTIDASR